MRRLYHHILNPQARTIRFMLAELGLDTDLVPEKPWERRREFLQLNPAGEVPVLIDEAAAARARGQQEMGLDAEAAEAEQSDLELTVTRGPKEAITICGTFPIVDYLCETYPDPNLLGDTAAEIAETRRLFDWFARKFHYEVSDLILHEKVVKRLSRVGIPDTAALRVGLNNMGPNLQYIGWLTSRRNWLAGDRFTIADIAAACQISALDYLGDIRWQEFQGARDWYARVKSRKSFRIILADHVSGMPPPKHYADPDF